MNKKNKKNKKDNTSNNIPDKTDIRLSKKDFDLIFKWYDKGFTNIEEDKPLLDRLKKTYNGVFYGGHN